MIKQFKGRYKIKILHDVYSLWEIAHRWHNTNPDATDPKVLPVEIQDTLRFLTRMLDRHEAIIASVAGVEYSNLNSIPSFDNYIPNKLLNVTMTDEEAEAGSTKRKTILDNMTTKESGIPITKEILDEYQQFCDQKTAQHSRMTEGFEQCYRNRIFDQEKLDKTYMTQWSLKELCLDQNIPLPEFWYKDDDQDNSSQETPRQSTIDKEVCRGIARTLWDIDPKVNIADMCKHKAIQQFGNGKLYKGKHTLREWIRDLDPRPPEKKTGRPKKAP